MLINFHLSKESSRYSLICFLTLFPLLSYSIILVFTYTYFYGTSFHFFGALDQNTQRITDTYFRYSPPAPT
jgi:hypothetical protein